MTDIEKKWFEAVAKGNIAEMTECLNEFVNINTLNDVQDTALHIMVDNGNIEAIKFVLKYNINVDVRRIETGRTALMDAIIKENEEIVALLLEYRASVTIEDRNRMTAWDYAKERGLVNTLQLIDRQSKLI